MDATVGRRAEERGLRESSWAYKQKEELKCVFRGETAIEGSMLFSAPPDLSRLDI